MDQATAEDFTALHDGLYEGALSAARSVEDTEGRARTLGVIAAKTRPFEAALPLWNEAADAAAQIEDPATRAYRLSSLLGDLRLNAR